MKTNTLNGSVEPQAVVNFDQLKENLQMNNESVANAIAEHNDAASQVSNQAIIAQPKMRPLTSDQPGTAKLGAVKKRRFYEEGISENVTNGERMVDVLVTLEPIYNPFNSAHSTASLTARNVAGRVILNEVRDNKQQKSDDGNTRREVFDICNKKFSQVFNQLAACDASEGTISNAKSILDEMRANRKGKPKLGAKTNSISRKSFSQMVDHVSDFLALLANCQEYGSNVTELQLIALQDYRDALILRNAKASKSKAQWNTAMVDRNAFFNAKNTGFVDTYQAAKRSVKAIFGANSPRYHQESHVAIFPSSKASPDTQIKNPISITKITLQNH